ncbi:type II CRISPR RNA-guided endonuclease Cas9 [Hyphomonas pacifica]
MTAWRLGLDVGSNSIGWAAIELDANGRPCGILKGGNDKQFLPGAGARIFPDGRNPKDKQSLAAQRRVPRGMRRNRDRYLQRREDFLGALVGFGLMPADETERKTLENPTGRKRNQDIEIRKDFDPWCLRARALNETLTPFQIGRALFHLQQRRGFKSNRKADKEAKDGKISKGAVETLARMQERHARTLGELFGRPRLEGNLHASTRARLSGEGTKAFYDFYPTRDLILDEFEKIWQVQATYHPTILTREAYDKLYSILSFQRPLKPQPVGRCTLEPETDLRAPWALPSSQRRRLYETLNAMHYRKPGEAAEWLTSEQRDLLAEKALSKKDLTFDDMRKALKFHGDVKFSIESEKRKKIEGDHTAAILANKNLWGKEWRKLPFAEQEAIVELLLGLEPLTDKTPAQVRQVTEAVIEQAASTFSISRGETKTLLTSSDPAVLAHWLSERYGLSYEIAIDVVDANLPDSHQGLGRRANAKVLAELMADDAPVYSEAVVRSGYRDHRATEGQGEVHDRKLPYYGEVLERSVAFGTGDPRDSLEKRVGKIANPTVHVALNQLRKVVNRLMERYGPPSEVVIELARDLPLGAEDKRKLEREQQDNQNANEQREKILNEYGIRNTYVNRLKLRLFEELTRGKATNGQCLLSGEQFGLAKLLSDEIEIDHILPFAQTLDDGFNNKTLVTRRANRDKARRSPYEAFGTSPSGYDWEEIASRAADLPPQKSWRFSPDAMERYENEERDFLERQLNDTKYIARLTRTYLGAIYGGGDEAVKHVWVTPGRLTSDLRSVWGLNRILDGNKPSDEPDAPSRKNRDDHRHHAIDAIVVALTDRAMLKKAADHANLQNSEVSSERMLAALGEPWKGFREDVERHVNAIVVSHKKDHGIEGQLHEDTNYGVVQNPQGDGQKLATRKPIVSFEKHGQLQYIADNRIREELMERTYGLSGADFKQALHDYVNEQKPGRRTNPRRVRVHKPVTESTPLRQIHHGGIGEYQRGVLAGENYCLDIVETPDGKWHCREISRFDANRLKGSDKAEVPGWMEDNPEALLVMRLRKGDMIAVEDVPGEIEYKRVVRLEPSANRVRLARDREAGDYEKRHTDRDDLFSWDFATISKLKARKARLVHVDEAGRVFDPGLRHAGTDCRNIK